MSTSIGSMLFLGVLTVIWLRYRSAPDRSRQIFAALEANARLIDERPLVDYQRHHLHNAESLPLSALAEGRSGLLEPTDRLIVVGEDDQQTAEAVIILKAAGFAKIIDAGPLSRWPVPVSS